MWSPYKWQHGSSDRLEEGNTKCMTFSQPDLTWQCLQFPHTISQPDISFTEDLGSPFLLNTSLATIVDGILTYISCLLAFSGY